MTTVLPSEPAAFSAERFTPRQRQVVSLIAAGCSNAEIGLLLGLSARTAKAHSDALRAKLGVAERRFIPLAYGCETGEDPFDLSELELSPAEVLRRLGVRL